MADNTLAHHPPAVKVGGRRLSISKPKPRISGSPPADSATIPKPADEETDYPRPAPPHSMTDNDDEHPKKEKRQGYGTHDNEKKVRESTHKKAEVIKPTKDASGGKGGFGGAGRVLQPSGKGFTV